MRPSVRALRQLGVRLLTLSNGATSVAEGLLARAGLADAFERLLVGVHPWDVDGAARAGLRSGWVNRNGARYPSYFRTPDVEAPDLVELARALR